MTLPVGTWTITTDTLGEGSLTITSVDASGNVTGAITVPGNAAVIGSFDAGSQTVNLANVADPTQPFFVFSADLFAVSSGSAKTHTTVDSILAGNYEAYPPGAPASTGRWVASITEKVKEKDKEEKETKEHKDKEKEKEGLKEIKEKEGLLEKTHLDLPQVSTPGDTALLTQFAMRLDAIEQRLASGRTFISPQDRPTVGDQAREDPEDQ